MISYRGTRETDGGSLFVHVHTDDDGGRPLNPRFDLHRHSPTGFECGYAGSGPAQLALAICVEHLTRHALRTQSATLLLDDAHDVASPVTVIADRVAQRVYQDFKFRVVAKLPRDDSWTLDDDKVGQHLDAIIAERVKAAAHAQTGS